MVEIDKLKISIKGEVHAWTECDGVITQEIRQPNLWLDNGIKNILSDTGTGVYKYLVISSNDVSPDYTDTVIPLVLEENTVVPSYDNDLRRHSFLTSFSPPVAEREIKTIGLTMALGGSNPYCFTKLSEPITQGITEVLFVYYYIYVIASDVDGFGKTGFDEIASNVFNVSNQDILNESYLYMAKNVAVNEILKDEATDFYETRWDSKTLRIENEDFAEPNRYLIKKITGNFGSSSELDSWTSSSWKGIFRYYGGFRKFLGQHVGRVWPKNKDCTDYFFSSSEDDLPEGYYKGFQVRAQESSFSFPTSLISLYINDSGDVVDSSYYYTENYKEDHYFNAFLLGNDDPRLVFLPNKFGRKTIIFSNHDEIYIYNYNTLGYRKITKSSNYSYYPIWDNHYKDKIFLLYRSSGSISQPINSIQQLSFSDENDMSSHVTETNYVGYNKIYYSQFINENTTPPFNNSGHEMLLWFMEDKKIGYFDPELSSNRFYDSYIGEDNVVIGETPSFGLYDEDNDTILLNTISGLMVYDKTGSNTINQFNGIADLSTEIIDWSLTEARYGGMAEQSDNKLKLALSNYSLETQLGSDENDHGTKIAQHLKAGEFEVTGYLSKFKPFEKDQMAGMFVENINTNVKGKFIYLTDNVSPVCDPTTIYQNVALLDNMEGISNVNELTLDWSFTGANTFWEIVDDQFYGGDSIGKSLRNSTFLNTGNSYASVRLITDQYYIFTCAYRYYDNLDLKVNNVDQPIGIYNTWHTFSYLLEPGENKIDWISAASSSDCYIWIDEVSFKPFDMETYTGAVTVSGVQGFTNISDITTRSSFVDLSDSTGIPEKIRFKITRNSSDVIKTYYSESDISVADGAAVWIDHNNSVDFVLSGEVVVGCFACNDEDNQGINVAEFSDFRINLVGGRTLDQTVDRCYRSVMLPYQNLDGGVYDTNASHEGTVIKTNAEYHIGRKKRILTLDSSSFELLNSRFTVEDNLSVKFGKDLDLVLFSSYEDNNKHNYYTSYIQTAYAYDEVSEKWCTVMKHSDLEHPTGWVDLFPYKNGLNMWYTWLFYDGSRVYNSWNRNFTFEWEEDSLLGDRWIMCDHDKTLPTPKLTSTSWSELHPLTKLEVRSKSDPDNPALTFSDEDKYTCILNQDGFSKDNMQYMESLHHYIYFCDAEQVQHLDTANSTTYTVSEKVANPGKYLWLDFGESVLYTFYLLTSASAIPKYHSDVLTGLSVDSVDPGDSVSQTFYADNDSIAANLQDEYNYYKGQYIKIGSDYEEILEYDNVTLGFTTFPFLVTPSGLFDITSPIPAAYTTDSIPDANEFSYDNGVITFNAVDASCGKDMTYVYVMRSW